MRKAYQEAAREILLKFALGHNLRVFFKLVDKKQPLMKLLHLVEKYLR